MNIKHIVISGNIRVGKTTLSKKISKKFNWDLQLEEVKDNISEILLKDIKKEYALDLIENKAWEEIQNILNPEPTLIANNPFKGDTEKI